MVVQSHLAVGGVGVCHVHEELVDSLGVVVHTRQVQGGIAHHVAHVNLTTKQEKNITGGMSFFFQKAPLER